MAGIFDMFMPQDFMNPNNVRPGPGDILRGIRPIGNAAAAAPPPAAAPAPAPAPAPMPEPGAIRAPIGIPDVAARAGDGMIQAAVNGPISAGPTINNAGVLSNAGGVTGFEPIAGGPSTPDARGLQAMGFTQNNDGSLRRSGSSPFDLQLNLMQELQRMAEQSAPGINAQDSATRDQQAAARSQYIGNQTQSLMQNFAPSIIPGQVAQDRLSLDRRAQEGFVGPGGQRIPGTLETNALEAAARGSANSPAGMRGQLGLSFLQNALQNGTPLGQALTELNSAFGGAGMQRPDFLGGTPSNPLSPTPPPATPGNTNPLAANAAPSDLRARMQMALNSARQAVVDPQSRAPRPYEGNRPAYDQAINNYLARFTPEEIGGNYNDVIGSLMTSPVGATAVQNWYQAALPFGQRGTPAQQAQAQARNIIAARLGHPLAQQTSLLPGRTITPGTATGTVVQTNRQGQRVEVPLNDLPWTTYAPRGTLPLQLR